MTTVPAAHHEVLRAARAADVPLLQEIEREAGEVFRLVGMDAVAQDEPLDLEVLRTYVEANRAWVGVDQSNSPVAYLLIDVVGGCGHVQQVSVAPSHARKGLGRLLLDHAAAWARREGLPALTLTTFAEVAWNAPYYERCGFRRLVPDELTEGLLRLRREEAEHGLDAWPRVCMLRPLVSAS